MLPSLPRPDNRLYLGRGGSGKTTLAIQHAVAFHRVLLLLPDDSEAPPPGFVFTRDWRTMVAMMMARQFRVAFDCRRDLELWERGNRAAFVAGQALVIWEEAGVFMHVGRLPDAAYDLWMRGRHRQARVFACSQRPARVSRDCTANLARAVVFNTTEPNDLKFFRAMMGGDAIDAIPRLDWGRHEAVDWNPAGWKIRAAPFP